MLKQYSKDPLREISETCSLAVDRILWQQQRAKEAGHADGGEAHTTNPYHSVDPAPPSKEKSVAKLRAKLLDTKATMFDRYRALFTLRNIGARRGCAFVDTPDAH